MNPQIDLTKHADEIMITAKAPKPVSFDQQQSELYREMSEKQRGKSNPSCSTAILRGTRPREQTEQAECSPTPETNKTIKPAKN
jgi:hypothetical protein